MAKSRQEDTSRSIRIAALVVVALSCLLLLELAARLLPWLEGLAPPAMVAVINTRLSLNAYQMPSSEYARHWQLRPGYFSQVADMVEAKRKSGRQEGARILEEAARAGYALPIQVNSQGFKGPELDPAHPYPRILVIGDSVTFGMGGWDYVRAAQGALAARGVAVEMVNGGVEGYAFANALREVPRYGAIHPDLCLVVLGWNDIFGQDSLFGTPWEYLRSAELALRVWRRLDERGRNPVEIALERRNKVKHPDAVSPNARWFREFHPPFLDLTETLGDQLAAGGCRVAITTLPSLFRTIRPPSAHALRVGHLPDFTDNPYVLAEIAEGTNAAYRALAARKGWLLVDMETFTDSPEFDETWFTDSVHFNAQGLTALGAWLAARLAPVAVSH